MDHVPTLAEIARRAGVATSTASRAFNEPHRLRPETVQRIKAVAEDLGYVANRYARALSTGRTGFIGLIVPDIVNPFFPPLVRAAQRQASQHERSLLVVETNSDPESERRHIASLIPECEGLIIASSRLTAAELQQVSTQVKLVLINNDTPQVARFLLSSASALNQVITRLADRGATTITYLGGPHRSWSEQERSGALAAAAEHLDLVTHTFRVESGTYNQARRMTEEVLGTKPDCVVAFDDVIAHGILDGLLEAGMRIPSDIAVVGCDDALPIQTHPRLTTISLPTASTVTRAIDALIACESATMPEMRVVAQGVLQLRETA